MALPTDKIAATGTVSLRYAGKLRHLGIGRAHAAQPVLMLIHDTHVITSHAATGEVLAEHHIDPDRDYEPPTRPPS
ncbi:hypothetical protein [Janibacter limosus]|uniref:Transposase n=1 Tax=Janibacter limosus TaxID=53458 RepID=A0A4P6MUL7_9MICO|nr:hypothetical protein [Janibacter limosus]QBF46669.1 hypothetical protein EXU32_10660 [Janibacter limosus]